MSNDFNEALAFVAKTVSADRAERIKDCKEGVAAIFAALHAGDEVTADLYQRVLVRLLLEVCRGD